LIEELADTFDFRKSYGVGVGGKCQGRDHNRLEELHNGTGPRYRKGLVDV
jgi:hypothetical protein